MKRPSTAKRDVPAIFQAVLDACGGQQGVTVGPGWGRGGIVLKRRGKIFAMLVRGELVAKLPRERVDALIAAGAGARFDPRRDGRVMKEWVALDVRAARQWPSFAREALAFAGAAGVLAKRRVR